MNKGFQKYSLILLVVFFMQPSCHPDFKKYDPPEWIEGKLFRQLQAIPGTEQFQICLERTGYDSILNNSNFSVFAPDDHAFDAFFERHPEFGSVSEIPQQEVLDLVQRHIIQNPWSRDQLQRADEEGWINIMDPDHNKPWSYKRQTLCQKENRRYWVTRTSDNSLTIVDSSESQQYITVYQASRKHVSFFFDHYLEIAKIKPRDFEFYFDRPYRPGYLYMCGAELAAEDYFAENGFIFVLDRVLEPLRNAEELLEHSEEGHNYSKFLDLVYLFPEIETNMEQTNDQEGVEQGIEVETLYDLDYDELAFDIHDEVTGDLHFNDRTATRYHYGILAPTNEALQELIDNVLTIGSGDSTRWPSFELVPRHIKRTIVNTHMSRTPVFLTDIERGFLNDEWDSVFVDPSSVVEKHYGSNASFFGINRAVVPRAFSSVTAPVYLRPQYIGLMKGLEKSGLGPALKRRNANYSFFIVQVEEDYFTNWDSLAVMNLLVDQVGLRIPLERSRKEFIPTMGGNFIVYDTTKRPKQLENPTDNGNTYMASNFYSPSTAKIYWTLRKHFRSFFNIMEQAGMLDATWGKLSFLNETQFHTVLAPTNEALSAFNTDTMTIEELEQFIKYHFILGDIVFTDGYKPQGDYSTLRMDESSTSYNTRFTRLDIRPEPGLLSIYNQSGELVDEIPETRKNTNLMFGVKKPAKQTMGVIHALDTVLFR